MEGGYIMRYNEPEQKSYEIIGIYHDSFSELIDTADSLREALFLTGEYQYSFGSDWRIYFSEL